MYVRTSCIDEFKCACSQEFLIPGNVIPLELKILAPISFTTGTSCQQNHLNRISWILVVNKTYCMIDKFPALFWLISNNLQKNKTLYTCTLPGVSILYIRLKIDCPMNYRVSQFVWLNGFKLISVLYNTQFDVCISSWLNHMIKELLFFFHQYGDLDHRTDIKKTQQ